ncbi:hypothetical protein GA0115258_112921 [Streptomyces sp. LamerLS-31b]|nr:hypothetical protein GA0115258_112921 [Streptomyces sp. LamerLS-31b]
MKCRLSGLTHQIPERRWSAPGCSGATPVAHPVAVSAQAGKIVKLGLPGPGDVQGRDVVHFDVALAELAVRMREVEVAHFAAEGAASAAHLLDLEFAQLGITLPSESPPDEKTSFDGCGARLIDLLGLRRDAVQLAGANAFLDGLGGLEHLGFTADECIDHQPCRLTASRGCSAVLRVVGREISGFAADAVWRPEPRQSKGFGAMDRKRAQQFRQLMHFRIPGPEFSPPVLHDQGSGQYELVFCPSRRPHEQYRMSVRRDGGCVQRTAGRAAHLVRSRCQWGLSPSVMVDCKMCLPLHGCKEGA